MAPMMLAGINVAGFSSDKITALVDLLVERLESELEEDFEADRTRTSAP